MTKSPAISPGSKKAWRRRLRLGKKRSAKEGVLLCKAGESPNCGRPKAQGIFKQMAVTLAERINLER